jgi:hypothetical protein
VSHDPGAAAGGRRIVGASQVVDDEVDRGVAESPHRVRVDTSGDEDVCAA